MKYLTRRGIKGNKKHSNILENVGMFWKAATKKIGEHSKKSPNRRFLDKMKYMKKEYAVFLVSFKLILRKNNRILILTESVTGFLDFPGGRIEKKEIALPIKDLFEREIKEELGKDVKYKILGPAIQYRRYNKFTKMYVLTTAYEAEYLSGKIKLSSEHNKYEWIDPKRYNLKNKKINNNEERLALEEYFKKFRIK